MKKTLLFIALVLGVSNISFAQATNAAATKNNAATTHTMEQKVDKRVERMTKALNLTAQQQASIKQILMQTGNTLQTAKQSHDKVQGKSAMASAEQQIEAVLNPEQKLKFEKAIAQQKAKNNDTQKAQHN